MESTKNINYKELSAQYSKGYYPSPSSWSDQVLYFLLVDRFSTGKEKAGELFQLADNGNAVQTAQAAAVWQEAGNKFCGGTIKGIASKLDYLANLGITALWVSPIFKQVSQLETYHGYGIQNFLELDPRFGSKQDLLDLVKKAHAKGIYIVLDIILNHSGNVWDYNTNGAPNYFNGQTYPTKGFFDKNRNAPATIASTEDGIWPREFQDLQTIFTRKGQINSWDNYPEYVEGDFCDLKDIDLGSDALDYYTPSNGMLALCEAYKYWIAFADIDGYRIDTVKHMGRAATRFFCREIKEFAQSINKQNFYLIGEVTGGRANAFDTVEVTGLNAALGIDDVQDKLEYLAKGFRNPEDYFNLFGNSKELNKDSHAWFNDKVVTMIDDHDQVRKGNSKARFCATDSALVYCALALNVSTLGIPCIYYGTEQYFDGQGGSDRYIRECMFGGDFGAFRSKGKHFFNQDHQLFTDIAKLLEFRKNCIEMKRGRQYLRPISGNGQDFGMPRVLGGKMTSVVAWSRIFNNSEIVCAINNNTTESLSVWVLVDSRLNNAGDSYTCRFTNNAAQMAFQQTTVVNHPMGKIINITVPPAGFAVWGK